MRIGKYRTKLTGAIAVPGVVALSLGLVLAAPAAAQTDVTCGDKITEDTTLTHDVGPCRGDGLIVTADNVTLDLNGHTIIGPHGTRSTSPTVDPKPGEHVGINLKQVSGVTVMNGEVRRFDAGVGIGRSSNNTVRNLNIHDNINHSALGGDINNCQFGDGIALFSSDDNRIVGNRVVHNGPLSGIALVGDSDGNQLVNNYVADNDVKAVTPDGGPILCGTGEDQGPMGSGREVQAIGIRIEGPGANNNTIANNTVTRNALAGIAVHGYVCDPPEGSGIPVGDSNNGNKIVNNTVTLTGVDTHEDDPQANGIALLEQGPAGVVCVSSNTKIIGNTVNNNFANGIYIGGRGSHDNKIVNNTVNNNDDDGIHITGPSDNGQVPGAVNNLIVGNSAHGNGGYDGFDGNPNCDDNKWRGNDFGTVNQPCVSGPGRGR